LFVNVFLLIADVGDRVDSAAIRLDDLLLGGTLSGLTPG
jgi:hypothetical protein